MARRFAGVMGMLAFATVVVRGIAAGGNGESIMSAAIPSLFAFAILGGIAGWLAEGIVDEAIRSRLTAEMKKQPVAANTKPGVRRTGG